MKKGSLLAASALPHALNERAVLQRCGAHPFLPRCAAACQDAAHLYLATDYCAGGTLGGLLRIHGAFDEKVSEFYVACAVCALEFLHERRIVSRGLSPDGILLGADGWPKLGDFGCAKELGGARPERGFRRELAAYARRVQRLSPSRVESDALLAYVELHSGLPLENLRPQKGRNGDEALEHLRPLLAWFKSHFPYNHPEEVLGNVRPSPRCVRRKTSPACRSCSTSPGTSFAPAAPVSRSAVRSQCSMMADETSSRCFAAPPAPRAGQCRLGLRDQAGQGH